VIVAGDLNDVAWSYTTRLFQKISGLLDPRIGRGRFSTFHAEYPILRWPLDHVFHSDHFRLVELKVLPAFGSDHFPILAALSFEPEKKKEQKEPEAGPEDQKEAQEKIDEGMREEKP
jgi:endonuclease/exonuclease/phosphatase (EEP) superfamily protein YafD